jgi:hypothetical protein
MHTAPKTNNSFETVPITPLDKLSPKTSSFSVKEFLRRACGLDRAISFTIAARGWSSFAGIVTLFAISRFLTPVEQGIYYTFSSLIALQIVFELGFSFVILQLASHEAAHLTRTSDGFEPASTAHARLASILKKTIGYYSVMAVAMALVLMPAGIFFFRMNGLSGTKGWLTPWCFVALLACACLPAAPLVSFFEGCGEVSQAAQLRLMQAVAGSLLAWSAFIVHAGLFAPGMVIAGQAICAALWLQRRRTMIFSLLRSDSKRDSVNWRTEIWPFQWRLAVSWISGYLIFQLFNPVLFAFQGPVVAGQMGMSLAVATALANIGLAWINTKASPFGTLVARRQYAELDRVFNGALRQSLALLGFASLLAWICAGISAHYLPAIGRRFLPPAPLGLLLATTVLNHIVFSQAIYLRAHKKESFLYLSVLSAAVVAASTYWLGRTSGATGVMWGYFFGHGVLCVVVGTIIFRRDRRNWHAP